ncbi:MAG: carboxymuconolactone decarboxylase family protein [Pseudobdellovibrio sp.]
MSLSAAIDSFLETTFPNHDSAPYRDLSLNFKKVMEDSPLEPIERLMNTAAIARALHWHSLEKMAATELKQLGLGDAEIQECFEAAAIMGMLNTYYKFKGFLSAEVLPDYARTGLRMNTLSKPLNGKERFEMMALAVSVVNSCPTCVSSHEKALTDIGVSRDKIHDLARLASVIKGLSCLH